MNMEIKHVYKAVLLKENFEQECEFWKERMETTLKGGTVKSDSLWKAAFLIMILVALVTLGLNYSVTGEWQLIFSFPLFGFMGAVIAISTVGPFAIYNKIRSKMNRKNKEVQIQEYKQNVEIIKENHETLMNMLYQQKLIAPKYFKREVLEKMIDMIQRGDTQDIRVAANKVEKEFPELFKKL